MKKDLTVIKTSIELYYGFSMGLTVYFGENEIISANIKKLPNPLFVTELELPDSGC